MNLLVYALPSSESFAQACARHLQAPAGRLHVHRFPDGEALVRFDTSPEGRDVVLVCSLARPDEHILPLLFAGDAARTQGARTVGLVAPYLTYLRQDRIFNRGEALTSLTFARLLSGAFEWLVTVDPHLHRYRSLDEVYAVPAAVASAAPAIADWIRDHVDRPLLIGPDEESLQWVAAIGARAGAPHATLVKQRLGDRQVHMDLPDLRAWRSFTPVLIDDIVSTGRTMCEAIAALSAVGMRPATCVGTHGIFAASAYDELVAAGAACVVTTNTVTHPSNQIDVTPSVAAAIRAVASRARARLHRPRQRQGLRTAGWRRSR